MKNLISFMIVIYFFLGCYSEKEVCQEKKGLTKSKEDNISSLEFACKSELLTMNNNIQERALVVCLYWIESERFCNSKSNIGLSLK